MPSLPVFADALSRLHADIAIVRLIRAGISADKISAVFPQRRAPNSVCCWLKNFHRIPVRSALPIAAAGMLGRLIQPGIRAVDVERKLENLGLAPDVAASLLERIQEGRIVLCVHARNDTQAAIAWHIFRHVRAENIVCAGDRLAWTARELPLLQPSVSGLAA
jgi:hypothetical protein